MKTALLLIGLVTIAGSRPAMSDQGPGAIIGPQPPPLQSMLAKATEARVALGDVEGNGRWALVVAAGRTVRIFDGEGRERYEEVFANGITDLAVGDVNDDGRDEVVVLSGDWLADRSLVRVIECESSEEAPEGAARIAVWTSPGLPFAQSLAPVRLSGRTVIAVGGKFEVVFLGHVGAGYAELRDKRVELRKLVPEGRRHEVAPDLALFGPGIGLVTGIVAFNLAPDKPRLALTARDIVSDTGGGAVVVLAWDSEWTVEGLLPTAFPPKALVAGDLVPGGAPELVATMSSGARLAGGWVLYEHRGAKWRERCRHHPAGEGEPSLQVVGLALAAKGRRLLIAANAYQHEELRSSYLAAYGWEARQQRMVRRWRHPFDDRLLALAVVPAVTAGEEEILVLSQSGGSLLPSMPEETQPWPGDRSGPPASRPPGGPGSNPFPSSAAPANADWWIRPSWGGRAQLAHRDRALLRALSGSKIPVAGDPDAVTEVSGVAR